MGTNLKLYCYIYNNMPSQITLCDLNFSSSLISEIFRASNAYMSILQNNIILICIPLFELRAFSAAKYIYFTSIK